MAKAKNTSLAGIEYAGVAGVSQECQDAVVRLVQFDDRIVLARILSHMGRHALLLTINGTDLVAIKGGFGSGYAGTAPNKLSYVLQLLSEYEVDIEEYDVESQLLDRLDQSALTMADIEFIRDAKPIHPTRFYDYMIERHYDWAKEGRLEKEFRPVVPFAIIDERITDLARSFWQNPDDKLTKAYRRLEDIVRDRTGSKESGSRLFSQAFQGTKAKLVWKDLDEGELMGRIHLFTGTYMAHRNPRAHRILKDHQHTVLSEFILVNHLYRLEKDAEKTDVG